MHRILKDTGSIYLQMDTKINHWMRCILDDVFGYDNFVNQIVWKRGATAKGNKKTNNISIDYDTILIYSKTKNFKINKLNIENDTTSLKEYKYFDEIEQKYFKIVNLGMYSKLSIQMMKDRNEIYTSKSGKEYKKYYLEDFIRGGISNIWVNCYDLYSGNNKEKVDYSTQKPKSLLDRIIKLSSNESDIVADFYCGSGTSLVVAKELNRNYIGCDINTNAVNITNKRLNYTEDKIKEYCGIFTIENNNKDL
jgi:DNA modification methylase